MQASMAEIERLERNQGAAVLSAFVRFAILERDGFRCRVCGQSRLEGDDVVLNVDHIIPKANGGTNQPSNLLTLCRPCNAGKRDKIVPAMVNCSLPPLDLSKYKESAKPIYRPKAPVFIVRLFTIGTDDKRACVWRHKGDRYEVRMGQRMAYRVDGKLSGWSWKKSHGFYGSIEIASKLIEELGGKDATDELEWVRATRREDIEKRMNVYRQELETT